MKVIGIAGGTGRGRTRVADRLVERLGEEGAVGRVGTAEGNASDGDSAEVTYRIGPDGTWSATGDGRSVRDVLDRLAPECDYAVVEADHDLDVARVGIGDHGLEDPLIEGETGEDVDPDAVVAALEEVEPHETLESLVARVKDSTESDRGGAIATFTGRVRARDGDDDPRTEFLEFEKYEGVAAERMAGIRDDLESREGVLEVVLHHRTGVVEAGEDIVFVVVLAGHREEAFRTVEDGIDRLKEEVPLFKREVTVEEEFWVHERG